MKIAFVEAGLWLFVTAIILLILSAEAAENTSDWLLFAFSGGFIVGAARFFYIWLQKLKEEKKSAKL